MKRTLLALSLAAGLSVAAFSAPGITLVAPTVTSWTQDGFSADAATLAGLNGQLQTAFDQIAAQLNSDYSNFDKLSGLDDLSKGFSNANMAAFDNASLLGYQNYDLFAVAIGFNVGGAVPALSLGAATSAVNDVTTAGDVYAGLSTGGIAAQAGLNIGFLVPDLYVTAKIGYIPNSALAQNVTAQQSMFGVGVNYRLMKPFDFGFGLVKWRGLSVGSGLIYNANTISAAVDVDSQTVDMGAISFDDGAGYTPTVNLSANTTNTKAQLKITSSAIIVPIDLMTSVQVLWFLNVGLGVGADLNFSSTTIGVGASSDLGITGTGAQITTKDGSAALNVSDSKGNGDIFVPRVAASLGLDLAIVKLDLPVSYYPTTKSFAVGFTAGIVW